MRAWQLVAAVTAAGPYRLVWLLLQLAQAVIWWQLAVASVVTLSQVGMLGGVWLLQALLLPPLRLGRTAYERRLAAGEEMPSLWVLLQGFRRWGSAVAWRWHVWWRRLAAMGVIALPTCFLWACADRLTQQRDGSMAPFLLFLLGVLTVPLGVLLGGVWACRYVAAPLLILEGCPAAAAMQLSAKAMVGHRRGYLDFWGEQLGRLTACLTVVATPFLLPRVRCAHVRWVARHLQKEMAAFDGVFRHSTCIFRASPV